MPEGPEVRTLVTQLQKHLLGELVCGKESEFFLAAKKETPNGLKNIIFQMDIFICRKLSVKEN